jgi:hypothetical protein
VAEFDTVAAMFTNKFGYVDGALKFEGKDYWGIQSVEMDGILI